MARLRMMTLYSAVCGTALLAGTLIASLLASGSVSTAGIMPPTAAPPQQPVPTATTLAQLALVALPSATLSPELPTVPPPTSTATPSVAPASFTATATSTSTPTPTARQVATPRPLVFAAQVVEQPNDAAVACGTAFDSRIWGVVKDRSGRGIFGAGVEIGSADGQHHYRSTTNDQGGFEIPGLGCTTWEIRLVDVPSASGGVQAQALYVSLNGGRYSGAGIQFQQR
jgi:hypothetical protein